MLFCLSEVETLTGRQKFRSDRRAPDQSRTKYRNNWSILLSFRYWLWPSLALPELHPRASCSAPPKPTSQTPAGLVLFSPYPGLKWSIRYRLDLGDQTLLTLEALTEAT